MRLSAAENKKHLLWKPNECNLGLISTSQPVEACVAQFAYCGGKVDYFIYRRGEISNYHVDRGNLNTARRRGGLFWPGPILKVHSSFSFLVYFSSWCRRWKCVNSKLTRGLWLIILHDRRVEPSEKKTDKYLPSLVWLYSNYLLEPARGVGIEFHRITWELMKSPRKFCLFQNL